MWMVEVAPKGEGRTAYSALVPATYLTNPAYAIVLEPDSQTPLMQCSSSFINNFLLLLHWNKWSRMRRVKTTCDPMTVRPMNQYMLYMNTSNDNRRLYHVKSCVDTSPPRKYPICLKLRAIPEKDLAPQQLEFLGAIVGNKKANGCNVSSQLGGDTWNKGQVNKSTDFSDCKHFSQRISRRVKKNVSNRSHPKDPEMTGDILYTHKNCFANQDKRFIPRILKSNAQSKLKSLGSYCSPRKHSEKHYKQEQLPRREERQSVKKKFVHQECLCNSEDWMYPSEVMDEGISSGMSSPSRKMLICKCSKIDGTPRKSVICKCSKIDEIPKNISKVIDEERSTGMSSPSRKTCTCKCPTIDEISKNNSKLSSHDSAYEGGMSSGVDTRGRTPEQNLGNLNYNICTSSVTEKDPRYKKQNEEALYLHFIHEITKDILLTGMFSNKWLLEVFHKHINRNKDRLCMDRMLAEIKKLQTELDICNDDDDVIDSEQPLSVLQNKVNEINKQKECKQNGFAERGEVPQQKQCLNDANNIKVCEDQCLTKCSCRKEASENIHQDLPDKDVLDEFTDALNICLRETSRKIDKSITSEKQNPSNCVCGFLDRESKSGLTYKDNAEATLKSQAERVTSQYASRDWYAGGRVQLAYNVMVEHGNPYQKLDGRPKEQIDVSNEDEDRTEPRFECDMNDNSEDDVLHYPFLNDDSVNGSPALSEASLVIYESFVTDAAVPNIISESYHRETGEQIDTPAFCFTETSECGKTEYDDVNECVDTPVYNIEEPDDNIQIYHSDIEICGKEDYCGLDDTLTYDDERECCMCGCYTTEVTPSQVFDSTTNNKEGICKRNGSCTGVPMNPKSNGSVVGFGLNARVMAGHCVKDGICPGGTDGLCMMHGLSTRRDSSSRVTAEPSARRESYSGVTPKPGARRESSNEMTEPSARHDSVGGTAEPSARPDSYSGVTAEPSARRDSYSGVTAEPSARRDSYSGVTAEPSAKCGCYGGVTPKPGARRESSNEMTKPSARHDSVGGTAEPSARPDSYSGVTAEPSARRDSYSGVTAEPSARRDSYSGVTAEPSAKCGCYGGVTAEPGVRRDSYGVVTAEPGARRDSYGVVTAEPGAKCNCYGGVTAEPSARRDSTSGVTAEPGTRHDSYSGVTAKPGARCDSYSGVTAKPDARCDCYGGVTVEPSARRDSHSGVTAEPGARRDSYSGVTAEPGARRDSYSGVTAEPGARRDSYSGVTAEPGARRDSYSGVTAEPGARRNSYSGVMAEPGARRDSYSGVTAEPGARRDSHSGVTAEPSASCDCCGGVMAEPSARHDSYSGVTAEPSVRRGSCCGVTTEPGARRVSLSGVTAEPGAGRDSYSGVMAEPGARHDSYSGVTAEPGARRDSYSGVGARRDSYSGVTAEPGARRDSYSGVTAEPGARRDSYSGVMAEPGARRDSYSGVMAEPGARRDSYSGVTAEPGARCNCYGGVMAEPSARRDSSNGVMAVPSLRRDSYNGGTFMHSSRPSCCTCAAVCVKHYCTGPCVKHDLHAGAKAGHSVRCDFSASVKAAPKVRRDTSARKIAGRSGKGEDFATTPVMHCNVRESYLMSNPLDITKCNSSSCEILCEETPSDLAFLIQSVGEHATAKLSQHLVSCKEGYYTNQTVQDTIIEEQPLSLSDSSNSSKYSDTNTDSMSPVDECMKDVTVNDLWLSSRKECHSKGTQYCG